MSAIEKAAEALADEMASADYMPPEIIAAIIKRELEKAVPAATASTHGSIDYVRGWNDRGVALGLEY